VPLLLALSPIGGGKGAAGGPSDAQVAVPRAHSVVAVHPPAPATALAGCVVLAGMIASWIAMSLLLQVRGGGACGGQYWAK
jgi:hypothetical protein